MKTDITFNYKDMVRVVYIDKSGEEQSVIKKAEKNYRDDVYLSISFSTKTGYISNLYSGQIYDEIVSIEIVEKYYPTASFGGANARICDLITDHQANVLFIRMCGQEDMVRSISAVIMQGRMKMNDHNLYFADFYAKVFPSGMKRILKPIGNGMVDCILYHRSLMPDIGMSALFHTNGNCFESFQKFLQILPIPRIYRLENGDMYEKEIMEHLQQKMILKSATTHVGSMTISCIDITALTENDYEILRDTIVGILEKQGYEKREVVEESLVEEKIVEPSYLKDCPEYGKTDGKEYKKVYAKFFSPSMTWYVTEYERESGICYGYVENLTDSYCSEWGTFFHKDVAEFKNKYPYSYIERDLYFEDKYIDLDGNIYDAMPNEKAA